MKIQRYFHIRAEHATRRKYNAATVLVTGNTECPDQVDVQVVVCSKRDLFCKKEGRSMVGAMPIKVVMLRYLPRELAHIEEHVYGYELENKNDFLYSIPYFLPKE